MYGSKTMPSYVEFVFLNLITGITFLTIEHFIKAHQVSSTEFAL